MKFKKIMLHVIGIIFSIVIAYNFIVNPMVMKNQKGMGMHQEMHNTLSYSYFFDYKYILYLVIFGAAIIMLVALYKFQSTSNRCRKCGYNVENERWRICPICGESLKGRKDDR